jgi:hypothetical protein
VTRARNTERHVSQPKCQADNLKQLPILSVPFNLLQLHHQRDLFPQREHSLLIWPVVAFRVQRDVEIPEKPRSNKSKLSVCKILANAVSWAEREGLESCFLICAELRVVQGMIGAQPSLRLEGIWLSEVVGIVVNRPLVDCYESLEISINVCSFQCSQSERKAAWVVGESWSGAKATVEFDLHLEQCSGR